ncbi:MAG: MFS transporter [Myxococcota bacterium]
MDAIARNPSRYLWFSALIQTPLFVPVVVLFWTDSGLTMLDVYLLQAAYAAGVVALEVPTGVLADRLGKSTSLKAGALLYALFFAAYAVAGSFWGFLLCELGLALAGSLVSGADVALLFDSLQARGEADRFKVWSGRAAAAQSVGIALSTVVGGFVGASSPRLAMALSAVGPLLALGVAETLVEVRPIEAATGSVRDAAARWIELTRVASRFVWRHQRVRWMLAALAVLNGSSTWLLWTYQPYFEHIGLPIWSFGLVFAVYNLFAAGSAAVAHRLTQGLGERWTLVLLALLQLAPLPLMASLVGPASFLFALGHQAVRGLGRPVIADAILAHTWADKRATVMSLSGLWTRGFFAATAPAIGLASVWLPIEGALWAQAAMLATALGALAASYASIPDKYHQVKPDRS